MFVEELKKHDYKEWENFLQSSPDGTFYHSLKLKEVIEKTFAYPAHYLVIKNRNGTIVGVCPSFIFRDRCFKVYASLPHSDFGGPTIKEGYVEKSSLLLKEVITKFCALQKISYAQILFADDMMARFYDSYMANVNRNTGIMLIDLVVTPSEVMWNNVFSRKQQYEIRRFERGGFYVREARTESDLRTFYALYLSNLKHLGVSGYPYDFFRNMWGI